MDKKKIFYKELPEKVYHLVMEGHYRLQPHETWINVENKFYEGYEDILDDLNFEYLPISYDAKEKVFFLDSEFISTTPVTALENYRRLFSRCHTEFFTTGDSDGIDKNEKLLLSGIVYRKPNVSYSAYQVYNRLGMPIQDGNDSYGWRENRKKLAYTVMGEICDRLLLPRLPIDFDEPSGTLFFQASEQEKKWFLFLAQDRNSSLEKLEQEAMQHSMQEKKRIDAKNLPEAECEELKNKIWSALSDKVDEIYNTQSEKWRLENETYRFSSAINKYSSEITDSFQENYDCTVKSADIDLKQYPIQEEKIFLEKQSTENKYLLN